MGGKSYRRWSRDITRNINNMLARDRRAISHIMDVEAERVKEYLINNMPVDTGELRNSVFLDHYETENGYGVGVGISSSQHRPDNFTNTKLAGWLLEKPNVPAKYGKKQSNSQQQMRDIYGTLVDLKYDIADEINAYWQSKKK